MGNRKHGETREEQSYPYDTESCSGTQDGWSVEARNVYPQPKTICGQTFDNRWRTVRFDKSPIGVPSGLESCLDRYAALLGYYPYESAQALRWWFIAELNRDSFGGLCVETRLVRHTVEYRLASKAISAHDNLGGDLAQYDNSRPIDMQGEGRKV